jgi:hypothetical protein
MQIKGRVESYGFMYFNFCEFLKNLKSGDGLDRTRDLLDTMLYANHYTT